tara:strand:- start:734 stop:1468 length:735 start_codon:yes stop_codon:yes gene_type:complete
VVVIVQPSNFTPVCLEYQQRIRDFFKWEIEDDEYVLKWLSENISKLNALWEIQKRKEYLYDLSLSIKSKNNFIVIGANVTKNEILELTEEDSLIVADGAIGSIIELNENLIENIVCIVSDGDGVPYICNKKIENLIVLLHAHGHAKNNLENILDIWKKWEKPPKIIISHQIFNHEEGAVNFGGFSDGDRAVCMLHAYGVERGNIRLMGFNVENIGPWSGLTDSKIKKEKLRWMQKILEDLGYDI